MADDAIPARERQHAVTAEDAVVLAACDGWLCIVRGSTCSLLSARPDCGAEAPWQLPAETAGPVAAARFNAAGDCLLTGGDDKRVCLWALPPGSDPAGTTFVCSWLHTKKIGCVAFSPDGERVVWADRFGEVFGTARREPAAAPALALGHLSPVSHLAFSLCGGAILSADREGHVRSSCWPDAFIIDHFCLAHTSPLQVLLPLRHAPLLISVASDGRDVCLWRMHSDALLARTTAAALLASHAPGAAADSAAADGGRDAAAAAAAAAAAGASSSAEAPSAPASSAGLVGACEVAPQRLVALCFRQVRRIVFSSTSCAWDGSAGALTPRVELGVEMEAPPLALAYSGRTAVLCALSAAAITLLPTMADGAGFDGAKAATLPLLPAPAAASGKRPRDEEDEEEDG